MRIDVEDYTQSVDDVVKAERLATYPLPLKVEDRRRLFDEWCGLNPDVLDEMELAALNIDARGLRVSAKYLTERQRYEGRVNIVGVPFFDGEGVRHLYAINNTDTPLIARWLLARHPDLNIETRRSVYGNKGDAHEAQGD